MSAGAGGAGQPAYRHTHSGRLVAGLIASGVVAVSVVVTARAGGRAAPAGAWAAVALASAVTLAAAAVFSAMTVEVDREALRWHFALGAVRKAVPRAEIASAEATATTRRDGIGIHRGPRGWVYNVALGSAVRVVRRDGRAFLLGTDDPDGLVDALAPASPLSRAQRGTHSTG